MVLLCAMWETAVANASCAVQFKAFLACGRLTRKMAMPFALTSNKIGVVIGLK